MKTTITLLLGLVLYFPAFGQEMTLPSDAGKFGLLEVFDAKCSDFAPASIRIDCARKSGLCRETRALDDGHGIIRLPSYLFTIRSWTNTTVIADDAEAQAIIINFKDRTAALLVKVRREGDKQTHTETHALLSTIPLVKK